jgi:hypothetical protein
LNFHVALVREELVVYPLPNWNVVVAAVETAAAVVTVATHAAHNNRVAVAIACTSLVSVYAYATTMCAGLPPTGSWQDLKDHLRNAGEICYADVFRDGTGVVEFARLDDMKTALRKFDDTKFRSHGGETSYIRLKEDSEGGREGGSRSRSTSRTPPRRDRRSPSYGRGEERRSGGDRRRRDSS